MPVCGNFSVCERVGAGHICKCIPGYNKDETNVCRNIDECTSDLNICHEEATCVDTEGSYNCECNDGFIGDGVNCTDINECDTNVCSPSANCINTKGSFSCKCLPGFVGDGFNCTGKIVWLLLVIFKLFCKY